MADAGLVVRCDRWGADPPNLGGAGNGTSIVW